MRTTINIRDDLMQRIRDRADAGHQSVSDVVNEILAQHLTASNVEQKPFGQKTYALGARPGINFHKSLDLAAELETDYTIDKLELRK